MKKTYINPVMDIVTLQYHSHLMAGSEQVKANPDGEATEWGGARHFGGFEDDEED